MHLIPGTRYVIQFQTALQSTADSEDGWMDLDSYVGLDVGERIAYSRSYTKVAEQIAAFRAEGDEETRFRIVQRTFGETVVEPREPLKYEDEDEDEALAAALYAADPRDGAVVRSEQ